MTKLTDAQALLLTRGAQREDGLISPAPKTPAHMAHAQASKLLAAGLVERVTIIPTAGVAWYEQNDETGDFLGFRVTAAGLQAVAIDESEWPEYATQEKVILADPPQEGANEMPAAWGAPPPTEREQDVTDAAAERAAHQEEQESELADAGDTGAQGGDAAQDDAQGQDGGEPAQGAPTAAAKPNLKDAAQAVVDGWTRISADGTLDSIQVMQPLVDALRIALAGKRTATVARPRLGGEPVLREGTKQQQVIDMLRAEGGATNPAIQQATGWASHTVRGFFAVLKKKGFNVQGEKVDGETIYRIAA